MAVTQEELTPRQLREADAQLQRTLLEVNMTMALDAIQDMAPFIDWRKIPYAVCHRMLDVYAKSFNAERLELQRRFDELYSDGMVPPVLEHIMANRMAAALSELEGLSEYIDWKRCDDVHLNVFIAAVAALHGVSSEELGSRFDNTF